MCSSENKETGISEPVESKEHPPTSQTISSDNKSENVIEADTALALPDQESLLENKQDKRFGFVLGKGYSAGKRFGSVLGHGMSFGNRFGGVLGRRINGGKRFGFVLGNGINFGKRYGSVLGKGYSFGKLERFGKVDLKEESDNNSIMSDLDNEKMADKRDTDSSIDRDIELVDLAGPVDEKRWVLNDIYGGYPTYKRAKRDIRHKKYIHYFGNLLGRGFTMGKRDNTHSTDDLPDEIGPLFALNTDPLLIGYNHEKDGHSYSAAEASGSKLGRQQNNYGRDQRDYFGSVLGRGFTFGKRDDEADLDAENGDMDIFTDSLDYDKIENDNEKFPYKRYFHSSPGYRFGKRDMEERDKRFGFILGRGLFGKRQPMPPKRKRPYGFVLGRGYSFGKRSLENTDDAQEAGEIYNLQDMGYDPEFSKRANFVLGKGYLFGKRAHKRFGWLLGNGLKFGKRDDTEYQSEDVSLFIDDYGNTYVRTDLIEDFDKLNSEYLDNTETRIYGCAGQLVAHQASYPDQFKNAFRDKTGILDFEKRSAEETVSYFIDDFGNIYVKADDIFENDRPLSGTEKEITYYTCDGQMTEILDEDFSDDHISKRGWGSVLGRGFRFGKRFGSKKRFGHILGSGFSWGK